MQGYNTWLMTRKIGQFANVIMHYTEYHTVNCSWAMIFLKFNMWLIQGIYTRVNLLRCTLFLQDLGLYLCIKLIFLYFSKSEMNLTF